MSGPGNRIASPLAAGQDRPEPAARGDPYVALSGQASPALARLTNREWEVLRWLAAGKTNAEIGAILGTSARTVQKHLEHVFVKLGVETRTAAIARALGLAAALRARP